jgi:three-Cys-motif partner protein
VAKDDKYWAEYDGLQHGKHQLLRKYLGAWFPILASRNGQVFYIDCHAGRGRHATGDDGSPILALRQLLEHKQRARILASTKVQFLFFEAERSNYDQLTAEIGALGTLPKNVKVAPILADYATQLREVIGRVRAQGARLAPSFAFVDPYGFDLSMNLLNDFLKFPNCELLINFMFRYVDMAMHRPEHAANMDTLYGTPDWRKLPPILDAVRRSEDAIGLFAAGLQATFVTRLNMRGNNGALKYILLHATNHKLGRQRMKEAQWALTPDGSFSISERSDARQPVLILPNPDLTALKAALRENFHGQDVRMRLIEDWLIVGDYLPKHLHQVIRQYLDEGRVTASGFEGDFAFSKNPRINFGRLDDLAVET